MVLNTLKYPLSRVPNIRTIQRSLSTQPAVSTKENQTSDVNCTVLSNKLMVSSLDLCGPLSRVSVTFRTASRHENHKNLGIVHVIRSLAGFGTEKCTGFAIWKNTQHNGIHMYCTGDREVTGFHIFGARTKINDTLKFLGAVVSAPAFKRWEVKDNLPRLLYEIKGLPPQVKVIDNLHSAAFRTGLGNSLFIKSYRIGDHTPSMLEEFYKDGFTANRASVSGYNVDHKDMIAFGQSLELFTNEISENNSKYFGGEIRCDLKSHFAHTAVAVQGVGIKDIKDFLAYSILQYAYGVRPCISWGGSQSPLYKAVHEAAPTAAASCFNVSYTDNGLFGFIISSYASEAGKALEAAVKVLRSGSVSDADFTRAKNMIKANLLFSSELSQNVIEDVSQQSLQGGVIIPAGVLVEAIEKITLSDVSSVAKKVASGKLTLSVYGELAEVPYLSDFQ